MRTNEEMYYECVKRFEWFLHGIGKHCLTAEVFAKIPTEWIVENYNVEMEFFRPIKKI